MGDNSASRPNIGAASMHNGAATVHKCRIGEIGRQRQQQRGCANGHNYFSQHDFSSTGSYLQQRPAPYGSD
jgi:hypothetical protein